MQNKVFLHLETCAVVISAAAGLQAKGSSRQQGVPEGDADDIQVRGKDRVFLIGAGSLPDIPDGLAGIIAVTLFGKGMQAEPQALGRFGRIILPAVPLDGVNAPSSMPSMRRPPA